MALTKVKGGVISDGSVTLSKLDTTGPNKAVLLGTGPGNAPVWESAIPTLLNTQTFNANGTWTKTGITGRPKFVIVRAWGGGGSGGRSGATTNNSGGGAGGSYHEAWFSYEELGATVAVTVGAGGVSRTTGTPVGGASGGSSTFDVLTAPGGSGGPASGVTVSSTTGSSVSSVNQSEDRQYIVVTRFDVATKTFVAVPTLIKNDGPTLLKDVGGAGGSASSGASGFGGSGGTSTNGGGGGGGTGYSGAFVYGAGGTSTNGGNGGAAGATATAGTAPGGGGGATGTGSSGAGAAGRVIVYTYG